MGTFDTIYVHKEIMDKIESLSKVKGFHSFQTKDLTNTLEEYVLTDDKEGFKLFKLEIPELDNPFYKKFIRTYTKKDETPNSFIKRKAGTKYFHASVWAIKNRKRLPFMVPNKIECYDFVENDKALHTLMLTFEEGILKDIEYLGDKW